METGQAQRFVVDGKHRRNTACRVVRMAEHRNSGSLYPAARLGISAGAKVECVIIGERYRRDMQEVEDLLSNAGVERKMQNFVIDARDGRISRDRALKVGDARVRVRKKVYRACRKKRRNSVRIGALAHVAVEHNVPDKKNRSEER